MQTSLWRALEDIPRFSAFAKDWRARVGRMFEAFARLCLDPAQWSATSLPCPNDCGCSHHIIPRRDGGGAVAVCRCNPPVCPDIPLTRAEITPLELNWAKLARGLCKAFGLANKFVRLPSDNTFQVGAWSADAVPAILTIQVFPNIFRGAVAELTSILRKPFILFAPTSAHLDATCQAMLANYGAGFFGLDTHLIITEQGTLHPCQVPGELFARFNPQPKEAEEEVARRAFAQMEEIDPEIFAIYRLYCREGLSAREVARRHGCSKTTVLRRLKAIGRKTGMDPKHLRTLSPHFEKIEADLADSRASHLYRKSHL